MVYEKYMEVAQELYFLKQHYESIVSLKPGIYR